MHSGGNRTCPQNAVYGAGIDKVYMAGFQRMGIEFLCGEADFSGHIEKFYFIMPVIGSKILSAGVFLGKSLEGKIGGAVAFLFPKQFYS